MELILKNLLKNKCNLIEEISEHIEAINSNVTKMINERKKQIILKMLKKSQCLL